MTAETTALAYPEGEDLPDALTVIGQLRVQTDDLHRQLLRLHRPRRVAGGQIRCTECATYVNGALRRMDWPCRTARAMGVVAL